MKKYIASEIDVEREAAYRSGYYDLEWHELKNEKPRIWGRYLVYFPANDKTNNGDYIDLCYWNGEKFLGGVTRGVYIGLEITHWMPLPEMPKG